MYCFKNSANWNMERPTEIHLIAAKEFSNNSRDIQSWCATKEMWITHELKRWSDSDSLTMQVNLIIRRALQNIYLCLVHELYPNHLINNLLLHFPPMKQVCSSIFMYLSRHMAEANFAATWSITKDSWCGLLWQ
jgi:hypothetical protein